MYSPTGNDIDFIAWGPFTSLNNVCYSQLTGNCSGCGSCPNNTSNPNFYPSGNIVDCSYSANSYEYLHINNAQTGQYYLLCITNYSNYTGTIEFYQQSGNATTNCNIVTCNMNNLTGTPSNCTPSTNTYSVSGTISFTGAPSTGQLIVSDNSGISQSFNPPFNSPISYTLNNINADGTTHTITAYFTSAPTCSMTITYQAPSPCNTCQANAGSDKTVCGLTTTLQASYSSNGISYQWSPVSGITFGDISSPTTSITASSAGTYTLTWNVTTTYGVTCSDQVVVTFYNPVAGFTYNGNQCVNNNSFNFYNTGSSGSGITYSWSFQGGTPSSSSAQNPSGITWNTAGTYTVTQIVYQGNCSASTQQTITVYPQPTISFNTTNVSCYGQCDGSITANIGGGGSPYSFLWNNGSTSSTISNLCAGTYTVTVTNSYGCTNSGSSTITQPQPLSLNLTRTNPTCDDLCNGTANVSVSGGIGPYSYIWSNGATTPSINNLCEGTYLVTVYDNASNNCSVIGSVSLVDPPGIVLNSSSQPATCGLNNGSATVSVTGGTPNYSYYWSNGSSTTNTPSTTNTITNIGANNYTVTVTDQNGCSKITTISVNNIDGPTINIISSTMPTCHSLCNGNVTAELSENLNPPFTYQWSTGTIIDNTTATTSTINNACAGTISVTVTDNYGCTAVSSINLSQPPQLIVNTSSLSAHCNNNDGIAEAIVTGGTPGYTFLWSENTGNQTTQIATNLYPGTYYVTVTDANNCTATNSVVVDNILGPSLVVTNINNVSCFGGNNGSATVSATGGTPPYSYQWPASANNQNTSTAINLSAGTYIVTVSDYYNCTNTIEVTITEPSKLDGMIHHINDVTCYGLCNGSATVIGNNGTPPYTYLWSNGQNTQNVSNLCANTYYVTITDSNNCTTTISVTISQPPQLSITLSSTSSYCNLGYGSASVNVSGGSPPYYYLWSNGQTSQTINNLYPDNYFVTVTDNNGCSIEGNTIVGNIPGGTVSIASFVDVSCYNYCDGSATAVMAGGYPPYTYIWSNGSTTQTINNLCAGLYYVTITDSLGCADIDSIIIKSPEPLYLNILVQDVICFDQCNGILTANVSGGTAPYSYSWSNGATSNQISNLCSGSYTVTITDANNCTIHDTRNISSIPPIIINGDVQNANCNQANGNIDITVQQAIPPLTFNWSNGATSEDLLNVPAGIYSVTVTDSKGCTATASFHIDNIAGPTVNIELYSPITCNSYCNGSLIANVSGGISPYLYNWSNGQTTPIATGLCSGIHTVTVTDAFGCEATHMFNLQEPLQLEIIQLTHTNPTCNGYCDGSASVVVNGGTPPYTYQWIGGNPSGGSTPTQSSTFNLCNGTYYVIITDNNNCSTSAFVNITEPSLLLLTTTSTPNTCFGYNDGTATVIPNGGTPPYIYQWSANTGGQITQTAYNLAPDTYFVTVYDSNNCIASASVNVSTPTPLEFSTINHTDLPCYMSNNGTITVNVQGGTPPYNFSWTNSNGTFNSNNQNLNNLPADVYYLTVTDANNCLITTNVIINQPPPLSVFINKTNETCYQYCDGSVEAYVNGGQMPYSYIWSNGSTSSIVTNLCPGLYTVTIVDDNQCSIIEQVNVLGAQELQIIVQDIVPASCGLSNGSATIAIVGGVGDYTIQWSTGGASLQEQNLSAGNHFVTVVDNNGCISVKTISVPNLSGPEITQIHVTHVTCTGYSNGTAIIEYNPSDPPAPPYNITWSNGDTNDTITGLSGGLYYVTIQDANGCIDVESFTIQEPTPLNSIVSGISHNKCYGNCEGTATVIAAGGTPPYSYTWLGLNQYSQFATNLCAGTYTLIITDANNCTTSQTITITQPDSLTITANISDVKCFNGNDGIINVYVTGGTPTYQYLWQPPISGTTSVAANLSAGTYSILVTDFWNCSKTATFTVNQPDSINVLTSIKPETCNSNNGMAWIENITGGTPPYYYTWIPFNLTTDTIYNLNTGTYILSVTDANECSHVSYVQIEEIPPITYITFETQNLSCYNSNDGKIKVNVEGGSPPYSYLWSNGQNEQTATNLSAGYYSVTITDYYNCSISGGISITEPNPVIPITFGIDTICAGNDYVNISVIAIGGTPPYTFYWTQPPVPNPTAQVISVSPDTTTTYYVNAYDANNCVSLQPGSVTVYVYPPLQAIINQNYTEICQGDTVIINVDVLGGKPPYNYLWNIGYGNPNIVVPYHTTTFIVTVTDHCNSYPAIDSTTIIVHQPPKIIKPPTSQNGCPPLTVNLNLTVEAESLPVTYLWNFGDILSGPLNISMDSIGTHTYQYPGEYDITITLTSLAGCKTIQKYNSLIKVYQPPTGEFTYTPSENINLANADIWFIAKTDQSNKIIWDFGDGTTIVGKNKVLHSYTYPGIYTVMLILVSQEGCIDTITQYIKVNEIFTIWAPNIIIPGSGILNGYFYPKGLGFDSSYYHLIIYDRWGNIIYETREMPPGTSLNYTEIINILNNQPNWNPGGWNGGFNNDPNNIVPPGSYIWVLITRDIFSGTFIEKSGIVNVIR